MRVHVRQRVEDGAKKHRGPKAASILHDPRYVTLRKAPSSSSASQQPTSRTARTSSRAAGAYLRTQASRRVPVRVRTGVWPRSRGPYPYPTVSAKLPSKRKRARCLGLARARITQQACACALAHETHAHSHRPSLRRLACKCCIANCAKADNMLRPTWQALELHLSRHTPLPLLFRAHVKCSCVCVSLQ